MKFWVYWS